MRGLIPFLLALSLTGVLAQTVFDSAKPFARPPGAPAASDVILRTLIKRPANPNDPHDTLAALDTFHVTRLEWSYIGDAAFIAQVHASGRLFGNAAAEPSFLRDTPAGWEDLACLNAAGEPVIASWKRTWKPTLWACQNNPDLRTSYLTYLKHCLDIGSDVIQRDEPDGNGYATRWGACFCDHCVAGFRIWLGGHITAAEREPLGIGDLATFDYRAVVNAAGAPVGDAFASWPGGRLKELFVEFQDDSTVEFNRWARSALDQYAGRRVAMSCNNGVRQWGPTQLVFDWACGELSYRDATAPRLHAAMAEARSHGKLQVVTMPLKNNYDQHEIWQELTRRTIAWSYAYGGWCMAPWDTYLPNDAPRYFGTGEQYADLYAFIRAIAPYLDEYEEVAAVGHGFTNEPDAPIALVEAEDRQAVLRVVPGHPERPAVVHIISGPNASPTVRLRLDPARFWGDRALRYRWLTPAEYDAEAHLQAVRTKDYAPLVRSVAIGGRRVAQLELAAPQPWGILVIEPDDSVPDRVWTPIIEPAEGGWYQPELVVTLRTGTSGGSIRYTLDEGLPQAEWKEYDQPLRLARTTKVTAQTVRNGVASAPIAVEFTRLAESAAPVPPAAPSLKPDLRLWLQAAETGADDGQEVTLWPATVGPPAQVPGAKLYDGQDPAGPTLRVKGLNNRPGLVFDGVDDTLAIPGFANQHLAAGAFTIFVVSQSDDDGFGLAGNALNGNGGIPRLYLTRHSMNYDGLSPLITLPAVTGRPAILVYSHDGQSTLEAWVDGVSAGKLENRPPVPEFGGGNLAMPIWGSNQNHPGILGEVVIYDRYLTAAEREGVTQEIAARFGLPYRQMWR